MKKLFFISLLLLIVLSVGQIALANPKVDLSVLYSDASYYGEGSSGFSITPHANYRLNDWLSLDGSLSFSWGKGDPSDDVETRIVLDTVIAAAFDVYTFGTLSIYAKAGIMGFYLHDKMDDSTTETAFFAGAGPGFTTIRYYHPKIKAIFDAFLAFGISSHGFSVGFRIFPSIIYEINSSIEVGLTGELLLVDMDSTYNRLNIGVNVGYTF